MRVDPVALPEFGMSVNWAMCRNPMCANFGTDLDVEIPPGQTQASSDRYVFKYGVARSGERTGIMTCRYCGQSSQLASNHAIRPIARYFLSLSMPFADCPDESCPTTASTSSSIGRTRAVRGAGTIAARRGST